MQEQLGETSQTAHGVSSHEVALPCPQTHLLLQVLAPAWTPGVSIRQVALDRIHARANIGQRKVPCLWAPSNREALDKAKEREGKGREKNLV